MKMRVDGVGFDEFAKGNGQIQIGFGQNANSHRIIMKAHFL